MDTRHKHVSPIPESLQISLDPVFERRSRRKMLHDPCIPQIEVSKSRTKTSKISKRVSRPCKQNGLDPIIPSSNRLTLRNPRRVGIFSKGKASSPAKPTGLPDLAFSEMKFLQKSFSTSQIVNSEPHAPTILPAKRQRQNSTSSEKAYTWSNSDTQPSKIHATLEYATCEMEANSPIAYSSINMVNHNPYQTVNDLPDGNHAAKKLDLPSSHDADISIPEQLKARKTPSIKESSGSPLSALLREFQEATRTAWVTARLQTNSLSDDSRQRGQDYHYQQTKQPPRCKLPRHDTLTESYNEPFHEAPDLGQDTDLNFDEMDSSLIDSSYPAHPQILHSDEKEPLETYLDVPYHGFWKRHRPY